LPRPLIPMVRWVFQRQSSFILGRKTEEMDFPEREGDTSVPNLPRIGIKGTRPTGIREATMFQRGKFKIKA